MLTSSIIIATIVHIYVLCKVYMSLIRVGVTLLQSTIIT